MLKTSLVQSTTELQQILSLQQANIKTNLSVAEIAEQGFVTVVHSLDILTQLHQLHPSIIVKDGDVLAGYALVMPVECAGLVPVLLPAFESIKKLTYQGKPMNDWRWYMMGQICVAKDYRGLGVFKMLYDGHRQLYEGQFDICVTEISTSNKRSLRAHEKVGFKTIDVFSDATDEWATVVLEL